MHSWHLTDDEHQVLIELLERELPDLRHEIHHTDDHDYRDFLRNRERLLEQLLASVQTSATATASSAGKNEQSIHSV